MELDEIVKLASCLDILWSEGSGKTVIISHACRAVSGLQSSLLLSPHIAEAFRCPM